MDLHIQKVADRMDEKRGAGHPTHILGSLREPKLGATRYIAFLFPLFLYPAQPANNHLPVFKALDLDNRIIDTDFCRGKISLFLFFSPTNLDHKGKIKYAQVIYDKFRDQSFNVIGVSRDDVEGTKRAKRLMDLQFPLLSDQKEVIHKAFSIAQCCGGIVLANRKGEVIFRSRNLIPSEHLRQLIEKNVLGKISDNFLGARWIPPFRIGDILPDLDLFDVNSNTAVRLSELRKDRKYVISFFSSFCSYCKQSKRIETLLKLNQGDMPRCLLVFMEPYTPEDIIELSNYFHFPFPRFTSSNIFPKDNLYITSDIFKCDPWTIVIDRKGALAFEEWPGLSEERVLLGVADALKDE